MAILDRRQTVGAVIIEDRLQDLLGLHFHPQWGSSYWLRRQEDLGMDICDRVRTLDDLWLLGPMPLPDLRRFPVRDFIPRALHGQWPRFVIGETAGTSGEPCATAYRDNEFQAAFVTPFLRVAEATGFPRGEPWYGSALPVHTSSGRWCASWPGRRAAWTPSASILIPAGPNGWPTAPRHGSATSITSSPRPLMC
jgi:hypothetical protein